MERSGKLRAFWRRDAGRTDATRFDALFLQHYPLVHRILARLLRSPEAVEDATQEVFLRFYRQVTSGTMLDDDAATRWLARVATNTGLNARRTEQRQDARLQRRALLDTAEEAARATDADPAIQALAREEADLVDRALAGMADRARACLLLRYGGFSYSELAVALDVAPGSVGTILARAEREFRHRYQELNPAAADERATSATASRS